MPSFLINGVSAHPGLDRFADAVAAAYAQRTRPQCLCSPSRPAMCIARIGPRYILRRMPGSGQQHDSRCGSWTDDLSVVERRNRPNRVSGQLRKTDPTSRGIAAVRSGPRRSPIPRAPSRSAQELLDDLWSRASLTNWLPLTDGHRSWETVRSRLLAAAAGMQHDQHPLLDRLYIPEAFDLGHVSDIYARRRARWREIRHMCSGLGGPAFVLAEVKGCKSTKNGPRILLRHVPDRPLRVETAALQTLEALQTDKTPQHHRQAHVIVLIAVDLDASSWHWRPASGVLRVDSLWRSLVKPHAVDTGSPDEASGAE